MKPTKWILLHVVQGYYAPGCGWEDVCCSEDRCEARDDLKAHRENQPEYPHRLIRRRVFALNLKPPNRKATPPGISRAHWRAMRHAKRKKTGMTTQKKVKLVLVGVNGNAYAIMGAFQRQARREGWLKEEVDAVLNEAMSGDYNHLLGVIMNHCENPVGGESDDE